MQQVNKKNRIKIIDRVASQRKIPLKIQSIPSKRNVKFSQIIVDSPQSRKKHHSASILKKRHKNSFQKGGQKRSDSVNSMASQNPLDDQSCQNSNLNKSIKQEYFNLFQNAKKKGKFTDQFFPPVISSLFSYAGRKKNKYPNVKWMRIADVFKNKQLIFINPSGSKTIIRPSTNLGAQYFSLALNCIKGNKNLLKKMFQDQKINQFGIYYVKIFQANVWKYIIVDDCIPVLENLSESILPRPVFITCQEPFAGQKLQIWPFILQKAFAKYYSSYQVLQTGNIYDFLQELTNKTCEQYNKQNSVNEDFTFHYNNTQLISFGETKQITKIPIHNQIAQNNNKLSFTLPNKQKLNVLPTQLFQYFEKLYLVGTKNFTYIGYCPIKQIKQSISVRQFSLKTLSFCSLSLNQKDKKFFQQPIKYQYRWVRMIIIQKQFNGGYRWIDGRYDNQKTLAIQSEFQPGDYFVVIMPQWGEKSYDLTLIIRSKIPVRLERKLYEDGMIEEACADLAQRYGRLNQLNSFICSYNCIHEDMGLIIENINNQRMKGQIKIVRSIDGLKSNVQIQAVNKQFQKSKQIQVIIRHNSHFTVVLKMKGGVDRHFIQTFDFGGK